MISPTLKPLVAAILFAAGCNAEAVRINADGHGQALVYPYYTARSTTSGNAWVTAFSVVNDSDRPKALKVRFLDGAAGADVMEFNLFLSAYDVWTAGIVPAGAGAGIFSADNSCTTPQLGTSSTNPTLFRNGAFPDDPVLGTSLDRTYEGYFEILEMGAIDPNSSLAASVTQVIDFSAPNRSKPRCTNLPTTDVVPTALSRPTGGLMGSASYINVNEGTEHGADAVALSQWSDRVQWSAFGRAKPDLSDASPAVSVVADAGVDGDRIVVTRWNSGRDAATALFMADRIVNDYTVEFAISASTDWVLTMPTKRFYVSQASAVAPFVPRTGARVVPWNCERGTTFPYYYDREGQSPGFPIDFLGPSYELDLCGAVAVMTTTRNSGAAPVSQLFRSRNVGNVPLNATWVNGWIELRATYGPSYIANQPTSALLAAPAGATSVLDPATGSFTAGLNATYYGMPIAGFAAHSYSTTGIPGVGANVLSSYGGTSVHRLTRRIDVGP